MHATFAAASDCLCRLFLQKCLRSTLSLVGQVSPHQKNARRHDVTLQWQWPIDLVNESGICSATNHTRFDAGRLPLICRGCSVLQANAGEA